MRKSEDKIALVTGAGTGLGRAIGITLAKEGFKVVLTGRREQELRKVEAEIGKERAIVLTADVTSEQSISELREKLLEHSGGYLDLLVNNVGGVPAMGAIGEMTLGDWKLVMDVNLTSQFLVTQAFLPALRKTDNAKIISVTSQMAHLFVNGFGAYSASKAAVEALMKTVAEEEKENGIEMHLFDPGEVVSEGNPNGKMDPMEVMGKVLDMIK